MRKERQVVHVISPQGLLWDCIQRKWVCWPKIVGLTERFFHSAKKAKNHFEELRRFGGCRWLTYKRGNLVRNRTVGFCPSFVHQNRKFDHSHLNDDNPWWPLALSLPNKAPG